MKKLFPVDSNGNPGIIFGFSIEDKRMKLTISVYFSRNWTGQPLKIHTELAWASWWKCCRLQQTEKFSERWEKEDNMDVQQDLTRWGVISTGC